MNRMSPALFAGLLAGLSLSAGAKEMSTLNQAQAAAALSAQAARAVSLESAKTGASTAIDGSDAVAGDNSVREGDKLRRATLAASASKKGKVEVPAVEGTPADGGGAAAHKPPQWAVYGGAALLGGLSAGLTGGLFAALGGAAVGVGAAYFFQKGDYGAAFGITLGGILGSFMGGPIGGLLGAAVGGLLGHFIGKLFHSAGS